MHGINRFVRLLVSTVVILVLGFVISGRGEENKTGTGSGKTGKKTVTVHGGGGGNRTGTGSASGTGSGEAEKKPVPFQLVSKYSCSDGYGTLKKIYFYKEYAYVINERKGLQIIDLSDLKKPKLLSTVDLPVPPEKFFGRTGYRYHLITICFKGSYIYGMDGSFNFFVIKVSKPEKPVLTGMLDSSISDRMRLTGNFWMKATGSKVKVIVEGKLWEFNVSNPRKPKCKQKKLPELLKLSAGISAQNGSHLYCASGDTLQIYDIKNKKKPKVVGSCKFQGEYLSGIALRGNFAFVYSGTKSNLHTIDISDPEKPFCVKTLKIGSFTTRVVFLDSYAFSTDIYKFRILDISNPKEPVIKEIYDAPYKYTDQKVINGYLYLMNHDNEFRIYKIPKKYLESSKKKTEKSSTDSDTKKGGK